MGEDGVADFTAFTLQPNRGFAFNVAFGSEFFGNLARLVFADIHEVTHGATARTTHVNNFKMRKAQRGEFTDHFAMFVFNFNYNVVGFSPSVNQDNHPCIQLGIEDAVKDSCVKDKKRKNWEV